MSRKCNFSKFSLQALTLISMATKLTYKYAYLKPEKFQAKLPNCN